MRISAVRNILKDKKYLLDKTIDVETIVSGKKYGFICKNGHIFHSFPTNAVNIDGRLCCPICSNRQVLVGVNDMWTTSPQLAKYLDNPEDGYTHTKSSNKMLKWTCPECKRSFLKTPNKMSYTKIKCQYCNVERSYAEKFVTAFLEQCKIDFQREKIFAWSQNKRYDFYVPCFRLIIETNGKQHYKKSFAFSDSRTLSEEIENDIIKYNLADQSDEIEYYISLNCENSDLTWIKQSILNSDIPDVFGSAIKNIDWSKCDEYATSNITKKICEAYNNETDLHTLCKLFHLSMNSIRDKLKYGTKLGWCNYDPKVAIRESHKKSAEYIIKNLSKPVVQIDGSGTIISEFNSIQEAQRVLNISHIWDCVSGKRKTTGGYEWRYKKDEQL